MKKNLQTLVNQSDVKNRHAVLCARLAAFGDMLKNEAEHGFENRDINWSSVGSLEHICGLMEDAALALGWKPEESISFLDAITNK